jgi:FkbM family methyltransferase
MSRTISEWELVLAPIIEENVETILSLLPDNGVFFDVGANVGLVTSRILEQKPGVTCYLFEPIKEYYDYCLQKFRGKSNVKVESWALSNMNGYSLMQQDDTNLGYNLVYQVHADKRENSYPTITLSDYIAKNTPPKIDFIKIDVEGHDLRVLEGLEPYLQQSGVRPTILFETGWHREEEALVIQRFQNTYGYKVIVERERDVVLSIP